MGGTRITDPEQVVLEAEPCRRLSYAGRTFTPQLAQTFGLSEEVLAKLVKERRSTLTFEIEPAGDTV